MLTLAAKKREQIGKELGQLRTTGFVPGIVYGAGVDALPITISTADFLKAWREVGESALFSLDVENEEPRVVLIRELQRDPMTSIPIHVDLHQVRMDETLQIPVPLAFVGNAPASQEGIGVLVKDLHEIDIRALPKDLPHEIEVDLSSLNAVDDAVLVRDLTIPAGVTLLVSDETTVAHIAPLISEKELEAAPEISLEEVEVVGQKKETTEEEGGEASAQKPKGAPEE